MIIKRDKLALTFYLLNQILIIEKKQLVIDPNKLKSSTSIQSFKNKIKNYIF